MPSAKRYAALAVVGIGFLAAGPLAIALEGSGSEELLVGLSVTGGVLLPLGAVWREQLRRIEGDIDERFSEIQYRAGWYAFWALMVPAWTMTFVRVNADLPPPRWLIAVVPVGGFVAYWVSELWLRRTM